MTGEVRLLMDIPAHPALSHLPLGGALIVPVLALYLLLRASEERRVWVAAVLLQTVVLIAGLAAAAEGESDALRIQFHVAAEPIASHEDAAHLFLGLALATWVALVGGLMARTAGRRRSLATIALALGILGATAGMRAGHKGGELIFLHGAAEAHRDDVRTPPSEPEPGSTAPPGSGTSPR